MFHAKHLHHDNLFLRNADDRWYRGLEKLCSTLSHCFFWMWHEEPRFCEDLNKNFLDSNVAATMSPLLLLFIFYPLGNQFWTHSSRKITLRLLQFKNVACQVISLFSDQKNMTFWKTSLALDAIFLSIFMSLSL